MRHLNKIIFLHSANIPYAEVMLDGNVHFSGTQGVGKSTLLRALLFFYNADKTHLGIQSGQKSFEEFYFPYSNSYIVYEVSMELSAYSILLSRYRGKVVYRFIDAPYQREWLMDSDGRVESDWIRIRERIGTRVDISARVETYELYRNIIFGNTHDRTHRYDKYALVESSKYQNIPRSIQNVFLNSKLDADFVKNTIIQSMTDDEDCIQLSAYRNQVAEFEREFDEIDCWFRKDKNGEVVVKAKAIRAIDTHKALISLDYEMRQTWHQLNYAMEHAREQLPIVEDEILVVKERLKKLKEKSANLREAFDKEQGMLNQKLGAVSDRLKNVRNKKKYYADIRIDVILQQAQREPALKAEKAQTEQQLALLQKQYDDVTEKFQALYAALEREWQSFTLAQNEALQRERDVLRTKRDALDKERDERKQRIDDSYNEWVECSDERMLTLQTACNQADKRLMELKHYHPLKQKTEAYQETIAQLKTSRLEVQGQLAVAHSNLKMKQQEAEARYQELDADYKHKDAECRDALQKLQGEMAKTQELLAHWDGSLYQWLSENKPGWEQTIGRVVDEEQVLYAQGLEPALAEGNSFYGIQLNLDSVAVHHRSPDEYRALQAEQQKTEAELKVRLTDLMAEHEAQLVAARRSFGEKLRGLQQTESNLNMQMMLIPQKIKDAETELRSIQNEELNLVAAEREKREKAYNEARLALNKETLERAQQLEKRKKNVKSADKQYKSRLAELHKKFDEYKDAQDEKKQEKKREQSDRKQKLKAQEREELNGKGADTSAIAECRKSLAEIERVLDEISRQHDTVVGFRKDEEELLLHEEEYREEKRNLEMRQAMTRQTYDDKCCSLEKKKAEEEDSLRQEQRTLDEMTEGLKRYEELQVENALSKDLLQDDRAEKCCTPCETLISRMRGSINGKRQKTEELKQRVNSFNSHFGPKNTFHFIQPQTDEEYQDFALSLQEFIENDKIEEYRKRVSDHYNDILRSISREVGLLMNHSANIKGIINDVNRDFQERNFAGVIRSIELRVEDSSDRLMQLLRSIRDFTEEHSLSMGQMNLFSGDDHDQVNERVVDYLKRLMKQLQREPSRTELTLSDTFRLQFRIQENDNNTGWVERINNVGSDGTDILVKAMVNIMLINVFKKKASRKNGDFIIHCMMDEIGKLHPSNVSGILQFANVRNIYLVNSSPMGYNADIYKYNYLLTKDQRAQTQVKLLISNSAL